MKLVRVLEVSNNKKTWIRLTAQSKNRLANCWTYSIKQFKYSRVKTLKVPNATKIENLL